MCTLADVYWHYVGIGHKDIDCRSFVSLCREGSLIDDTSFKDTDAERIFMQCMPLAKRRLDFARFEDALMRIAEAKGQESAHVRELLVTGVSHSQNIAPQRPTAENRHRSKSTGHKKAGKRSSSKRHHRDRKKEAAAPTMDGLDVDADDAHLASPAMSPMHRPLDPEQEPEDVIALDEDDAHDEAPLVPSNGWLKGARQPPAPQGLAPPQPLGMCPASPCEESMSTSLPSSASSPSSPDATQDAANNGSLSSSSSSNNLLPMPLPRMGRPSSAARRREQLEPIAPSSPTMTPSPTPLGSLTPEPSDQRSPLLGPSHSPRPAAAGGPAVTPLPRMQADTDESMPSPTSSPSKQAHNPPELTTSSSCPALRTIPEHHRTRHPAGEEGDDSGRGPPTLLNSSRRTSLPAACSSGSKLVSKNGQACSSACPTELPPANQQRGGLICGIGGAAAPFGDSAAAGEAAAPYLDPAGGGAGRQRQRPQTAGRAEGGARSSPERVSKRSVEETFFAFAHGQHTLDSKGFVKLCKRCCLLDQKFTAADARLLFSVAVPVDKVKMDLLCFEKALALVAQKRGLEHGLVYRMVSWYERPMGERAHDGSGSPVAACSGGAGASFGSESDIAAHTWGGEAAPEELASSPSGSVPPSPAAVAPPGAVPLAPVAGAAVAPSAPKEPRMTVRPRMGSRTLTRSQSVPCVGGLPRPRRRTEDIHALGKAKRSTPPEIDVPPLALDALPGRGRNMDPEVSPEPRPEPEHRDDADSGSADADDPDTIDAATRGAVPPPKAASPPVASSAAVEMAMSRESLVMRPHFVGAF